MFILGSAMVNVLVVLFFCVSVFMILVILIQKPKGGGLSGAFGGGGGGSDAVFGTKIGDALTWFTVACFIGFMGLGIALTILVKAEQNQQVPASIVEVLDTSTDAGEAGDVPATTTEPEAAPAAVEATTDAVADETKAEADTPAPADAKTE